MTCVLWLARLFCLRVSCPTLMTNLALLIRQRKGFYISCSHSVCLLQGLESLVPTLFSYFSSSSHRHISQKEPKNIDFHDNNNIVDSLKRFTWPLNRHDYIYYSPVSAPDCQEWLIPLRRGSNKEKEILIRFESSLCIRRFLFCFNGKNF